MLSTERRGGGGNWERRLWERGHAERANHGLAQGADRIGMRIRMQFKDESDAKDDECVPSWV